MNRSSFDGREKSGIIQKDDQKHSELIFVCNNNHLGS